MYFPDAGAEYSAPALTWKKAGHNVAFHPYEIAVSNAVDRDSAQKELDGLIALVNRTWERRAEITPSFEARRRPTVMDVFKLLPQTNCKQCGQPTCYTFALKLAASQKGCKTARRCSSRNTPTSSPRCKTWSLMRPRLDEVRHEKGIDAHA